MHTILRGILASSAVAAALSVSAASAQNVFTGTDEAKTRNEDLAEAIKDDAERDLDRFGNENRPQGWTGSFALRATATSGNTDSVDVGAGANIGYVDGPNGYELQLNYSLGKDNGVVTEKSMFYGFEYDRDINANLFGFAKVQGSVDEFSTFDTDTFANVGVGYRIVNTPDTQWSLQAGPGYRFAKFSITAPDVSEAGFGASSNFYQKLSATTALTNDTDLISSSTDTLVTNDLALSVSMSDTLALRTSVLTEYHSDPLPGFKNTDNTFGVSVVFTAK